MKNDAEDPMYDEADLLAVVVAMAIAGISTLAVVLATESREASGLWRDMGLHSLRLLTGWTVFATTLIAWGILRRRWNRRCWRSNGDSADKGDDQQEQTPEIQGPAQSSATERQSENAGEGHRPT